MTTGYIPNLLEIPGAYRLTASYLGDVAIVVNFFQIHEMFHSVPFFRHTKSEPTGYFVDSQKDSCTKGIPLGSV